MPAGLLHITDGGIVQQRESESRSHPEGQSGASGPEISRHEERLSVTKAPHDQGAIRVRKRIDTERIEEYVPRQIEDADVEQTAANPDDSGEIETLSDGSLSVPILEEELVITKRVIVRERIIIRKRTRTEQAQVTENLRKERIEVDASPGIEIDTEASG